MRDLNAKKNVVRRNFRPTMMVQEWELKVRLAPVIKAIGFPRC